MAATLSLVPWPRYQPRRYGRPHSACSGSRRSTYRAGLRRLGYDRRGPRGTPLWRAPVGLLLSSSGDRSRPAPRLRLAHLPLAAAGCTTGSPRPLGAHYLLAGRSSEPLPHHGWQVPYECRAERSRLRRSGHPSTRLLLRGNFSELRVCELRGIPIPRTPVNKGHEDRAWIPVSPESPSDTNLMPYCGVGHPCDCSDAP
jgi:hypothetical protein